MTASTVIYDSWPPIGDISRISLVHTYRGPVEPDSPVLRSGFSPSMVGLGFGPLEPFGISFTNILAPTLSLCAEAKCTHRTQILCDLRVSASPTASSFPNSKFPFRTVLFRRLLVLQFHRRNETVQEKQFVCSICLP